MREEETTSGCLKLRWSPARRLVFAARKSHRLEAIDEVVVARARRLDRDAFDSQFPASRSRADVPAFEYRLPRFNPDQEEEFLGQIRTGHIPGVSPALARTLVFPASQVR